MSEPEPREFRYPEPDTFQLEETRGWEPYPPVADQSGPALPEYIAPEGRPDPVTMRAPFAWGSRSRWQSTCPTCFEWPPEARAPGCGCWSASSSSFRLRPCGTDSRAERCSTSTGRG